MTELEGHPRRVVIEDVDPQIDCGRFAAKSCVGDLFEVTAFVFLDGHDALSAVLLHREEGGDAWIEAPMEPLGNDRWRAAFRPERLGYHEYTIEAWPDAYESWRRDLGKKHAAGQNVSVELLEGTRLLRAAAERAEAAGEPREAAFLRTRAEELRETADRGPDRGVALATEQDVAATARRWADRERATRYPRILRVWCDRPEARCGAWYEMFPRSCTDDASRHATLEDVVERLEYVASMGFDVLYLPPIHPIGRSFRKGRGNTLEAGPGDPGSPWAIGSDEGGHTDIHPELGDLADFRRLVEAAAERDMEIALDIAFQCSPDHPWVREHPSWFRERPDGSIQYAENPPKKYQDIYPLDFETEDRQSLWDALRDVFLFWIEQGVRIFRVDNPHTKPFRFWEWCIEEVRSRHPGVILLSEAFTRPSVMYHLAKLGFTQSYTYFTWRNTPGEMEDYLRELTATEVRHYFRPNFWPNTPDILNEYLQTGGRAAFQIRLVLAATLSANYGIYGPPFELCVAEPREPGSEEYLHSEKYEIRSWDLDDPLGIQPLVRRINRVRRDHRALQRNDTLRFHGVDNERLLAYSKLDPEGEGATILVVVNFDPHHTQSGWTDLDLEVLGLDPEESFQVHDLVGGARYLWRGARNFVELDPAVLPCHVFRLEHRHRTERDFDYFS